MSSGINKPVAEGGARGAMPPTGKILVLKVRGDPYEKGDFGGLPPPPPHGDLPATGLGINIHGLFRCTWIRNSLPRSVLRSSAID